MRFIYETVMYKGNTNFIENRPSQDENCITMAQLFLVIRIQLLNQMKRKQFRIVLL